MKVPDWIQEVRYLTPKQKDYLPCYAPLLTGNEKKYVNQCLDETWLSSKGRFVVELEEAFASYVGTKHAVSCSSGTAAIFLPLQAIGVSEGDEVIVPTFTMVATAYAVTYCGAKPVFVDCEPRFGGMDPESFEQAITPKTKAVIPVDIYGHPVDMDAINAIAKKHGIHVIEDAAEALGSVYKGRRVGSLTDFSTFSMYINKLVTSGEGGMITLDDTKMYRKLKRINNYHFSDIRHFWHKGVGYNFRLSNLEAAVGLGQIEHLDDTVKRKRRLFAWYDKRLKSLRKYLKPFKEPKDTVSNYWYVGYTLTDKKGTVTPLRKAMSDAAIETRAFFIPLHMQPVYYEEENQGAFPNAELLGRTGLLLPSGPGLTEDQVDMVCEAIHTFFKKHG